MKSLNEDLKTGQFNQIYLLCGDEGYLKKQYKERLVKAMIPEGDTMNYTYFEGKNTNPKEIIDLAETLPFFADVRLIVLENTNFFKNASPELAEYIKDMPESTHMIFVEEELDKRGKLYKAVKAKGRVVEMKRQDERTLVRWILQLAKQEKKQMSETAARYLLEKTGDDMENILQEMEKLTCYCMSRGEMTEADIEEICTTRVTNHIFDMVDAVANREQKKALDYYYDLLALKEPPMRILYLLTRQFRILMEVKELERLGLPPKEMASKVGIMPFLVGKYRAQARAFSGKQLRGIVEAGVETEENVKTGKMQDVLSVELFLVKYSARSGG
ncbi:MAG: DNA polymerase III subunit delta [Coprococcus sp.]|nr:DNA polymerase III subunit delta [Coprococcus sp.]